MNRFEILSAGPNVILYDRLNKTGKIADIKHKEFLKSSAIDDISFQFAIYPNKLLSAVRISVVFQIVFNILLITTFCFAIYLLCIYLKYVHGSILFSVLLIPFITPFSMLFHELSHAFVGAGLGGVVAEIGATSLTPFRLHTVLYWLNNSVIKRCLYLFAGVMSNILLVIFFILLFVVTKSCLCLSVISVNVFLLLLNMIPLKRLDSDGYKIICTITEYRNAKKAENNPL